MTNCTVEVVEKEKLIPVLTGVVVWLIGIGFSLLTVMALQALQLRRLTELVASMRADSSAEMRSRLVAEKKSDAVDIE